VKSYGLPSDRLVITDKTRTRREYLQRFNQIDIALDT
jgi:predicted O-linked N-acetylglucosamine transferase (SPINDLY family)